MLPPEWLKPLLDQPWPAWTVAALLALFGLWLTWRGLLGDRSRGRRRCPKCWYDLRGTPGMRCSECGFEARRERTLLKSRRRWRVTLCGVASLFIGGAIGLWPKVQRDGWLSVVPTSVLILATPADAGTSFLQPVLPAEAELHRRQAGGTLLDWQWAYLAKHRFLMFRRVWPQQFPLVVYGRTPVWTGAGGIHVSHFDEVAAPLDGFLWTTESYQVVGEPAKDSDGVNVRCTVSRRRNSWRVPRIAQPDQDDREVAWTGSIRLPIRIVDSLDKAIRPSRSPEVDAVMRRALTIIADEVPRTCGNTPRLVGLTIQFNRSMSDRLAGIAFGFSVDVLRGPVVVETLQIPLRPPDAIISRMLGEGGWYVLRHVSVDVINNGDPENAYRLRVRGDAQAALLDWDKPEYWDGEFTIALSDAARSPSRD